MQTSSGNDRTINSDSIIQFSPLDFIRSGLYNYSSGGINGRSGSGYYWQLRVYSETNARSLGFASTGLNPQDGNYKGYGFTVRCLAR